ncbi:MAG: hypothetical protein J6O99_06170 [Methanobrevibacter sp.]|nr:hypothetical protein [Methanobrevibacter sp.]
MDLSSDKPQVERVKIDLPREFVRAVIDYNKFDEGLRDVKEKIQSLDNKPMLDLTVAGGDFDSADVYETIKETIGGNVLNLRPSFKPDKVLEEERIIDENKILDPRALLQKRVKEKYGREEVNKLSIDLLDNLSVGRIDDAKFISDRFYSQHYFDEEKANAELNDAKTDASDSLDDYLDKNLDSTDDDSNNLKSKQISFDDF